MNSFYDQLVGYGFAIGFALIVGLITFIYTLISGYINRNKISKIFDAKYNTYSELNLDRLNGMNIENLTISYNTSKIEGFNIKVAQTKLKNCVSQKFKIYHIFVVENYIYLKIKYAIPILDDDKCYSTSFSLNTLLSNDSVSIYGAPAINDKEREVFKEIANELIIQLSK